MAILWMDGFDHYGGLRANLLLGAYVRAGSQIVVSTERARSGGYSITSSSNTSGAIDFEWAHPTPISTFGVSFGFYAAAAYGGNNQLVVFKDSAAGVMCSLVLTVSGALELRRGLFTGTLLCQTNPCITYGAWNHVEFKIHISQTVGYIEIRVNEVPVTLASGSFTGLDNSNTANTTCSTMEFWVYGISSTRRYIDDLVIWDTTGTQNNDFIGDRRIITLLPNANEATQEMTVTGAANAYTAIQSADGDTSYITASDSVPVTSEFALEDPGPTVGAINAVQVVTMMRKIEAGPANVQASLLSGSDASAGTNHSITDSYAYYADIHNTDPATGAPWSASGLAAARLRLRRNT